MAAAFTSTTSPRTACDVFLSFRGAETRTGFTDHLYTALDQAGIRTFRYDDDIERGEVIETEIRKGIETSKAAVIVFSKDYASSPWCLDELAMIMARRRTDGLVVIPVFYNVDPDEVSEQSGGCGQAFAVHVERFAMERIGRWRKALRDVANLAGMVLGSSYEAPFIQNVVQEVSRRLNRKLLDVPPYLAGVESHVKKISLWLRPELSDVKTVVICGIGGIGKTTIAKVLYNQHYTSFDGSSFLADITRKTLEQPTGLLPVQSQLLYDIQRGKSEKIHSEDEGIIKIRDAISCKRVLIVLDDVDGSEQFNTILRMQKWLHPGSKIIVTTRSMSLLKAQEGCKMVEIKALAVIESRKLFSFHAFGKTHPDEGYLELTESAVKYCGGLPLALAVLGSHLRGERDVDVWESALKEIRETSHPTIQKILKMSYDSLLNDGRRELFLDIACFFIGMEKDYVAMITDGCGYHSKVGIQDLVNRCLITIDEYNILIMHQLIRDMGRRIVHEQCPKDPGERTRVWDHNDAFRVLNQRTGTESIHSLSLDRLMLERDKSELPDERRTKRRRIDLLPWQPINDARPNSSAMRNLRTEAFAKMQRLELLQLSYVKLVGDYKNFPQSLVWLCWRGYSSDRVPNDLCLENLVILEMRNSSLKRLWSGTKRVPKLKILNLSQSRSLVATPDFNGLPSLERLILDGCINLVEIHDSIGNLERIVFMSLEGCQRLNRMQFAPGNSLISNLFSALSPQSVLGRFSPMRRMNPSSFPFISFLPRSLVHLSLRNCNISDDKIPHDLSFLPGLQHLDLSFNPLHSLPESVVYLSSLQTLELKSCQRLQYLPPLSPRIERLNIENCKSLERLGWIPGLLQFLFFNNEDCDNLAEVGGQFKFQPMREIDREMINRLAMFNLDCIGEDEVTMVNAFAKVSKTCLPQVLREFGIFSFFLSGSEIPDWYEHSCYVDEDDAGQEGSWSFSVQVPRLANNKKIIGLNWCVVYTLKNGSVGKKNILNFPFIHINNTTRDVGWCYRPTCFEIPSAFADKRWFSHMSHGKQLGQGDQLTFSIQHAGTEIYRIRRIGIHFVVCDEEEEEEYKEGSGSHSVHSSVTSSPWYKVLTTYKYFSNHQIGQTGHFFLYHPFNVMPLIPPCLGYKYESNL